MKILITGMSGTGTTSTLLALARHGWRTIDTDYGEWTISDPDGEPVWDEVKMGGLLSATLATEKLAVAGCVINQGNFYNQFDAIILLTASIEVMLERIDRRTNNPYGKTPEQRADIWSNTNVVVPQLRRSADLEIVTDTLSSAEVAARILAFLETRH